MRLKSGVRIFGVRPEIVFAMNVANEVYSRHKLELVITSIMDSKHSVGSLHYVGCAFDCRTRSLDVQTIEQIRTAIRTAIGDDYDVVVENNHVHIEFQPKQSYG